MNGEKGGAVTPIGDPPNIIVASNPVVVASVRRFQINFLLELFHQPTIFDRALISSHSPRTWWPESFWL